MHHMAEFVEECVNFRKTQQRRSVRCWFGHISKNGTRRRDLVLSCAVATGDHRNYALVAEFSVARVHIEVKVTAQLVGLTIRHGIPATQRTQKTRHLTCQRSISVAKQDEQYSHI